jgi:predicted Zn-dependent protease
MPRSLYSDATYLSREQAKALADRVLRFSTADEAKVTISSGWTGNTRFSGGEINTSGGATDTNVTVTSTIGRKRASASTNVLEDDALRRTVDLAQRLARLSPDDPELMPELGPSDFVEVKSVFDSTAGLTPEARAAAVKQTIDAARAESGNAGDLFIAGFLDADAGASAVATSKGLFAYHRATAANYSTTVRTPDGTGSGWASDGARDWKTMDPTALGRRAARKAVASRNPVAIEPGQYTVVMEPQAVSDLVPLLAGSLNARAAEEGRSAFSKRGVQGATRVGEKVADERVTILSDPADPDVLGRPFDNDGLALWRRVWIENGVLKQLVYNRFWAQRRGVEPTGGGGGGFGGGLPGGIKMLGGTKTLDQLIAGTERGILVTRFWYIRSLDQRTVLNTGLTRDGTFLIENGKVTKSLKNFRWNESPLFMLNKIDELGIAERTGPGQVFPSIRARDFNFTSLSDAV